MRKTLSMLSVMPINCLFFLVVCRSSSIKVLTVKANSSQTSSLALSSKPFETLCKDCILQEEEEGAAASATFQICWPLYSIKTGTLSYKKGGSLELQLLVLESPETRLRGIERPEKWKEVTRLFGASSRVVLTHPSFSLIPVPRWWLRPQSPLCLWRPDSVYPSRQRRGRKTFDLYHSSILTQFERPSEYPWNTNKVGK